MCASSSDTNPHPRAGEGRSHGAVANAPCKSKFSAFLFSFQSNVVAFCLVGF